DGIRDFHVTGVQTCALPILARKSYEEGGCPIGAVVIDNATRRILGKGHNTLVQENHPYNHGETSAIRDAGRRDFSKTTIFTSLKIGRASCRERVWSTAGAVA